MTSNESVISSALLFAALLSAGCSSDDEPAGQGGDSASSAGVGGSGVGGSGGVPGGSGPAGEFPAAVRKYDYAFDLASGAAQSQLSLEVAAPGGDCTTLSCTLPVETVTWAGETATVADVTQGKLAACGAGLVDLTGLYGVFGAIP